MNKEKADKLLERFLKAELSPAEMQEFEQCIEEGFIDLGQISHFQEIQANLDAVKIPEPSEKLQSEFQARLRQKSQSARRGNMLDGLYIWLESTGWSPTTVRLAWAIVWLVVGTGIGVMITARSNDANELASLTNEVQEVKELMMLAMLEKQSATERLKAVNLTHEITRAHVRVITALTGTLNHDENVNVRLAAIDALLRYTNNAAARKGLIEAIAHQSSPMVQVALADAMVLLKDRSAIEMLQQLLQNDSTDLTVKEKVKESIEKII